MGRSKKPHTAAPGTDIQASVFGFASVPTQATAG